MIRHRPWLAHYDYWVPPTLTYPERPLCEILDTAVIELPTHIATRFLGATLTFRDIKTRSDWFAAALGHLGITRGDRIGIMLPNCPQYMIAAFAVLRHGAVVVNLNPTYTAPEVLTIAADSGLRMVLTLDVLVPLIAGIQAKTAIEHILVTSMAEYSSAGTPTPPVEGTLSFADMTRGDGRPPVTRAAIDPDDLAVLQYTGGTTGTPKGAMLTHRNIFANVVQTEFATYRDRTRGVSRYLVVIPYFHIYGFTVGMMKGVWVGAQQILIPKYEPEVMLAAIRDYVPTYVPAVPTIYLSLLAHPEAPVSGLDRVAIFTSGGAPCPLELIDAWEQTFGRALYEGFGLSETAPVTHSTPQLGLRKPGSVGLPMPDTDIKVVDIETGTRDLPWGEAGELCISGPQVMKGYWRQPDDTASALRTDASGTVWFFTGDIARIDADGYTTIVQRKKDMILVDAFNVYPSEVEAVLYLHPAVRLAAVIGVPDDYHGERVRACLVLKEGAEVTTEELLDHCRASLAPYKVPREFDLRPTLPMSAVGKILYRLLRDELHTPEDPR